MSHSNLTRTITTIWTDAAGDLTGDNRTIEQFNKCYAAYAALLRYSLVIKRITVTMAEDVVQETFLKYWRMLLSGCVVDNPKAWLFRAATNLVKDVLGSAWVARRERAHFAHAAIQSHSDYAPEVSDWRTALSREDSPDDSASRNELKAAVTGALRKLKPAARELLYELYFTASTVTDVAAKRKRKPSAIHMQACRARDALAKELTLANVV